MKLMFLNNFVFWSKETKFVKTLLKWDKSIKESC